MPIRKLSAGEQAYDPATYVGTKGTMFYNEDTGEFRISDAVTPGGLPIPITLATSTHAGAIKPGPGFTIDVNGLLGLKAGPSFYLDETDTFRLKAGTSTQIGGVKSGNGIIIASDGTINIDTAGLSFAFGDFYAFTNTGAHDGACLSSVNENQDINLVSNGTGMVNVVGEFHIHKTNMDVEGALAADPVFVVSSSGYLTVNTPNVPNGAPGALNIVGSLDGTYMPVNGAGGMLHITGNPDTSARVTIDGWTTSATDPQPATAIGAGLITLRASRGTPASPLPTKAGDHLGTIAALGKVGNAAGYSQGQTGLLFYAAEDYTLNTAIGSYAVIQAVPVGSNVAQISARFDYDGVTATNFRGNLTGNVAGNVSGSAGSVVNALTAGTYLTSTGTYNGSTARTFAVDATTDNTVSKVVARDSNGLITAQNYKGNSRDAGTLGAGATLTINYATDHHVLVNITGAITIAHQNITAGRNVKVVIINATGGNLSVDTGVSNLNTTGGNATANLNANRTGVYEYISFGTTTTTLYANVNK